MFMCYSLALKIIETFFHFDEISSRKACLLHLLVYTSAGA